MEELDERLIFIKSLIQIVEVCNGPSSWPIQLRIDRAEDSTIERHEVRA